MGSIFERKPREQRRVVVTGIGAITPIGLDLNQTWQNAINGVSGIGSITQFDPINYDVKIAGEVKGFEIDKFIPKKEQKKMGRFIHLFLATTQMAFEDCGLVIDEKIAHRCGTIVGVGMGGLPEIEDQHKVLLDRGPGRVTPFFIPMVISNMAPGHVSILHKVKGPNFTITSACASGAHALGEAVSYIRNGFCDVMITGGTESVVCPTAIGGFSAMKALSTRNEQPQMASRPFDKGRDGFVLSEGSCTIILEDYEFALKRGATIYAEVSGYGVSSDANHMTAPSTDGEGAAYAMQMAIMDASITADKIDYINAHGTSTPAGDIAETKAIKRVFGEASKKVWISSTKSMTGHTLGAAGAIESAFCLMSLKTGIVPPTINLENPSEECDLDYVPAVAREKNIRYALNNSFGFGGTNATLLFSKI